MIEIVGRYNTAICYTDIIEPEAYAQVLRVCNEAAFSDSKIRIMPDVHAGAGCTIGTTMTLTERVVPNMVGVDIGCGMYTANVGNVDIDLGVFDEAAHSIPSGRAVRDRKYVSFDLTQLRCYKYLSDIPRLENSLGTLGGGNHFIEIDADNEGNKYIIIHSGSRNLGTQVAKHYQKKAEMLCSGKGLFGKKRDELIKVYKESGRKKEIDKALKELELSCVALDPHISRDLSYLSGEAMADYIHDIEICQQFAKQSREIMMEILLQKCGLTVKDSFQTIHNYIDTENIILRKGSVSARAGEKLLIPINMRDGSLICIGKGNEDWNYSAPHGAGRLMSRSDAKISLSMDEYKEQMQGIYTTCVNTGTLDESPMAYKSMQDIVDNIGPTADIIAHIRPLYNFKAAE